MARQMNYSARLPFTAAEAYEILASEEYWEASIAELNKYSPNRLERVDIDSSGVHVTMRHIVPRSELPDIAQAVMKKDMVITRNIHHGPFSEVTAGHYDASIPAGPGSLTGVTELFSTPSGCTLRTCSTAKVYIPFVGGKLEQLMLVNLRDLWKGEGEHMHRYLADKHGHSHMEEPYVPPVSRVEPETSIDLGTQKP